MRIEEVDYWNKVGEVAVASRKENVYKRCALVSRILKRPPVKASVLEIGCGKGFTATAVTAACCGNIHYTATELAPSFIEYARNFNLHVVQTDILSLPNGPFDQVWAFDTLEHVRAEDRPAGYAEINRVLAKHGTICLNLPLGESKHVDDFEHGITDHDVTELASVCGARVVEWEYYQVLIPQLRYSWVVLQR